MIGWLVRRAKPNWAEAELLEEDGDTDLLSDQYQ